MCVLQQSQPDIKWVENAKSLFKVKTHVASTIYAQVQHFILHSFLKYPQTYTVCINVASIKRVCADDSNVVLFPPQDLHLHKFFQHCQLMRTTPEGNKAELIKYLKVRYCEAARSQTPTSRISISREGFDIIVNYLPVVPARHGDSCNDQLPTNGADAAV